MNRTGYSFFPRHWHSLALGISWLLVQSILFYQYGIHTEMEAAKYIHEARLLLNEGRVSSSNYWLYTCQILLIAAAIKLNTGFFSVYLVQLLFNALATAAFYRLLVKIGNRQTAFVLTLFLIGCIPMQTFNSFLQTESLFYSFTILFSCYLLGIQKLTVRTSLLVFLFLVLVCITRPTGLLFVPGCFLYLFFKFARVLSTIVKLGITTAGSVLFLFILNVALGSGGELDFMLPYRDERIICGVPTLPQFREIEVADNPNSVYGMLYYITNNFDQFTRLAWLRTKAFFGLVRPYYSQGHNIYLFLFFFPFYLLVLFSLRKWLKRNKYVLLYCLVVIMITWLTVILTCDDWHNRFFLSVVPYIYILSVPMVQAIMEKLTPNDSKRSIQTGTI
jgi:4-amino-4-deoxy-L-arabinose transferase-like glycosyltransferase